MSEVIHFAKHLLGLCGESHPNLFIGGGVILSALVVYWTKIVNHIKDLL
jgi:hypothetical protein